MALKWLTVASYESHGSFRSLLEEGDSCFLPPGKATSLTMELNPLQWILHWQFCQQRLEQLHVRLLV